MISTDRRALIAAHAIGAGKSLTVASAISGLSVSTVHRLCESHGFERIAPNDGSRVVRILYLSRTADKTLCQAAEARDSQPESIAEDILHRIGADSIIDAVLDDGGRTPT